jgi:hypothetical protein
VHLWGAQLEAGVYASTYTPTTSAARLTTNNLNVPTGNVTIGQGLSVGNTTLINHLVSQNTGIFQANGNMSVTGSVVARNINLQGNNNLIQSSQDLTNISIWNGNNTAISGVVTTLSPFTTQLSQNTNSYLSTNSYGNLILPGRTYTASAWIWSTTNAGSVMTFRLCDPSGVTNFNLPITLTATPTRYVITGTFPLSNPQAFIQVVFDNRTLSGADATTKTYNVFGVQAELGAVASPYTPTYGTPVTANNNVNVPNGNVFVGATQSTYSTTNNAITVTGSIGTANSIYVGNRVGFANSNNISVIYQSYNSSTNSLDVVFG